MAPRQIETILIDGKQHSTLTSDVNPNEPEIGPTKREKSVLKAILDDPEASRNFEFLCKKTGCSAETLTTYFVEEAWGPKVVIEHRGQRFQAISKLRSLAASLKRVATKIKEANEMPFWRFTVPRIGLVVTPSSQVQTIFCNLPDSLMLYARNMGTKVEIASAFRRAKPVRRKALELAFAESLACWIEAQTGHRYRDRVASIQRVTYRMAGRKQLPASGETLRKRDHRKNK